MILFYAMGGGWGHLKRVSTFIRNEQIEEFKVITSNPLAGRFFAEYQLRVISNDLCQRQSDLIAALDSIIGEENPDTLVIDVFPNGILGELSLVPTVWNLELILLSRRLKWIRYQSKISMELSYSASYIFEDLEARHMDFLASQAEKCIFYQMEYEVFPIPNPFQSTGTEVWLIIHGFDGEEVETLCLYALEKARREVNRPIVLLGSDCDPGIPGIVKVEEKEPIVLAPHVHKLFTGCGFNIMQETIRFRDKQLIMPFPRKYDDQFWRLNRLGELL